MELQDESLRVHSPTIRDNKPPGVQMKLFLKEIGAGVILLCGEDANGDEWEIAEIDRSGIRFSHHIGTSSGWPIDELGRLKQTNEQN